MASARGRQPNHIVPVGGRLNQPQRSDRPATGTENRELDRRMKILEDLVHALQEKENVQIKELQNKVQNLEEQVAQHQIQIKHLEDQIMRLQTRDSNESGVETVITNGIKETLASQTHTVVRQQENDRMATSSIQNRADDVAVQSKGENATTYATVAGLQKQKHHSTASSDEKSSEISTQTITTSNSQMQSSDSVEQHHGDIKDLDAEKHAENNPKKHESKNINEQSSVPSLQISSPNHNATGAAERPRNSSKTKLIFQRIDFTGRPVTFGNNVFTRWMNSRDTDFSIWSNESYSRSLLRYISKIYGQEHCWKKVLSPLRIQFNRSDELDQLHQVIQRLAEQTGAMESLYRWRTDTRSSKRLTEIAAIFEYNSAYPSELDGLKILFSSPADLEQIIPRDSVKGYFDLICRDGLITAEIGEYLHLNRENIFGGDDYDYHNERVTFINVNPNQSTIDLADNRVDLITCFVTLHHVPDLDSMLRELVRILRPDGYLLLREHDCKKERSLRMKYLNFIHAFMMIARVGEFGIRPGDHPNRQQNEASANSENDTVDWEQQKSEIINYTNSIQYRSRDEWDKKLEYAGFRLKAVLDYGNQGLTNPQALYYAIYQLSTTSLN